MVMVTDRRKMHAVEHTVDANRYAERRECSHIKRGCLRRINMRCWVAALLIICMTVLPIISVILPGATAFAAETEVASDTAAGGDTDIKATITVASNKSKQEMQPYLDAFNKKYPGIQIDFNYYSDYETEVGAQMESGEYPDVLFVPGSVGSDKFAEYFEPLGSRQDLEKKYQYLEGSKLVKDTVYGVPSSAYVNGIIYNKEVWAKAGITDTPKSIDEFLEDLSMIKDRTDAIPFYTNYAADWTLQAWEQYPFLAMTGDPDYKLNGFVNELDPFLEGTTHYQVYKLLYDIVSEGLSESDPEKTDWDQSKIMLNEGQIGCMAIGSWALKQVQDAGSNGDNIAYMPFPNEVDGKQYMTIVDDYCYAINKNSEQKEAARDYIDFMLDESGYATDQEVLSVVKTDPILEVYGDMNSVICQCDNEASDNNYQKRQTLSTNLNILDSTDEIKRVIEAAAGKRNETFDEIAEDWNERWESSRTEDMMPEGSSHAIVLNSALSQNYDVEFSDTEQEYIDSLDTIRVGYLNDMAPFQYYDGGSFRGVLKDVMDIVADKLGASLQEKGYDNTQELVKALKSGEIDMIAGMSKSGRYSSELKFSVKSMDAMRVMVKSDSNKSNEALKGTMAQVKGEDYSDLQTEASDIRTTATLTESLEDIENLKADFTVSDYYSVYYYTEKEGFEHLDVTPISGNDSLYFAFTKDCDTRMISVCNKVLYSIPDENIQIMLDEYMKTENQKISFRRFVEANTIPFLIALIVFFAIVIAVIVIFAKQRAKIAKIDALTGLYNRYGIRDSMKVLYDKKKFPMVVSILDIDNFKSVNDTLGHQGGDAALQLLGNTMKQVFGKNTVLGRYGGDEFVISFSTKDMDGVNAKFGELVKRMDRRFEFSGDEVNLSISVGVAVVEKEIDYDDLFKAADAALYEVKEKGKNSFKVKKWTS